MASLENRLKCLIVLFTFLIVLSGGTVMIVAGVVLSKLADWDVLLDTDINKIKVPLILMIVFGCLTFIISPLGCLGPKKESIKLLSAHTILVLIVGSLTGVGYFVLVTTAIMKAKGTIERDLKLHFSKIETDRKSKSGFDALQKKFECCGLNGKEDYAIQGMVVPDSCCTNYGKGCARKGKIHSQGCQDKAVGFLNTSGNASGGILVISNIFVFFEAALAAVLILVIKEKNRA